MKIFKFSALCILFIFTLTFCSPSYSAQNTDTSFENDIESHATKHILSNRMTVLVDEMPTRSSVALYALIKAGSATEGKYRGTGISHLLEHMFFKGTRRRPRGAIAKEVQSLGGKINASTSFDYTIFYIELPAQHFEQGVDILSDMLMNPSFDAEEMEKEKEVILNEMRLYRDRPDHALSEMVLSTAYQRHPYRTPIIGYEDLFTQITREDLVTHYHTHYVPRNIIFSIAGNITTDKAVEAVEKAFASFPAATPPLRALTQEPTQISTRHTTGSYPTDLTRMSLAYQGISVTNPDLYAMDCLAMILGKGRSSRLYQDLVENHKLVYAISASNFTPVDTGIFEIECVLDEKNMPATLEAIQEIIQHLQSKGITRDELEKVKRAVISNEIFSRQTPGGRARSQALAESHTGDYLFAQHYVEEIQKLTPQDISRAANMYLIDQRLSINILTPEHSSTDNSTTPSEKQETTIQKHILDNGLTVLFKEDHTSPIITITLAAHGGTRAEPEKLNGLSQLTASTWTKETRSRSVAELAETIEKAGGSISGFSGRNSFGLNGAFLSSDTELALDLVEDLVKTPAFTEETFLKQKQLQQAAILARNDTIFERTAMKLRETLFTTHPFGREIIGSQGSVAAITRDNVVSFYEQHMAPNNMVLSVFGDISIENLLPLIRKKFGSLKKHGVDLPNFAPEKIKTQRRAEIALKKEQAIVMLGFLAPSFNDNDRYAMRVATSVIASPLSGRLFTTIRDTLGEAYTLGSSYIPGPDLGMVILYVNTSAEAVPAVKEIIYNEIQRLHEEPVTEEEIQNIKTFLTGIFEMEIETIESLCSTVTFDELYGLGHDNYTHHSENINAVTAEDIQRVARKYFNLAHSAEVVATPEKSNIKSQ